LSVRALARRRGHLRLQESHHLVDTTVGTVFHNLGEGAGLVILVLLAFMLSLRAALIVAAVIPLSLAASFAYLHARGMSANLLSMGAVDFGIIVDGAVILVEHLFHKLSPPHARDGAPPAAIDSRPLAARIFEASREVARPTLFSLLIIIAAYLPIFRSNASKVASSRRSPTPWSAR
jgi:cobalt-zinc-cadmium resistance protein CzcA